jgi:hypothetical protein
MMVKIMAELKMKLFRAIVLMERDEEIAITDIYVIAPYDTVAWDILEEKLKKDGWTKYEIVNMIEEKMDEEKVLGVVLSM